MKTKVMDIVIKQFLKKISPLRGVIEDIYLFGSRSRNDYTPDSDYDILIVIKRKESMTIDKIYDAVLEILLATGKFISVKVFYSYEFNRLKSIPTPFISNVIKEGVNLGRDN